MTEIASQEMYSEKFSKAPEPNESMDTEDIGEFILALSDTTDITMLEDITGSIGMQLALQKGIMTICSGLAPIPPQMKAALIVLKKSKNLTNKLRNTIDSALDFL